MSIARVKYDENNTNLKIPNRIIFDDRYLEIEIKNITPDDYDKLVYQIIKANDILIKLYLEYNIIIKDLQTLKNIVYNLIENGYKIIRGLYCDIFKTDSVIIDKIFYDKFNNCYGAATKYRFFDITSNKSHKSIFGHYECYGFNQTDFYIPFEFYNTMVLSEDNFINKKDYEEYRDIFIKYNSKESMKRRKKENSFWEKIKKMI